MLELIPKNIFEFKTIVLDLTNRCNLKCPLCFRTNTEIDSLYDQDFKQVKQLLKKQISNKFQTAKFKYQTRPFEILKIVD